MIKVLLKAKDYKQFINQMLENPLFGRGAKTRLAEHLRVQGSFISLVLSGPQDFSADHGIKIAEFLKLSATETEFFITLLNRDRAGTPGLRDYYQKLLDRQTVALDPARVQIKSKEVLASEADLSIYYGAWFNTAIHMAIHHPQSRTVADLVATTNLKESQVRESIDLLVRLGFARFEKDKVLPSERRFHLDKRSLALRSHHINWRHQAVKSLDETSSEAMHYSLVMNADADTIQKIRQLLTESIRKTDLHLEKSKSESVYSLCLDLFKVF